VSFSPNVWNQLKNITAKELISALDKAKWTRDVTIGAEQIFRSPDGRRVSIHVHPGKTFGPNLLKSLLADIGWSEKKMREYRLIK
jgi:predicted RNA binding protein YcfA (HicA-like mRNA interferase family)